MQYSTTLQHSKEILDQAPPHSLEAERAVLGAITLDPGRLDEVAAILSPVDFSDPLHQAVYHSQLAMRQQGQPVDPIGLRARMTEHPLIRSSGEATELIARLMQSVTVASHASHHAKLVKEAARKRRTLEVGLALAQAIQSGKDADEAMADAQAELEAILRGTDHEDSPRPVGIEQLIADYPQLAEPVIGGWLRRSEVGNMIAASKVGKSWLCYLISLSKAAGLDLFSRFPCPRGRVLLIDNELHPATLAYRIQKVAEALGLRSEDYQDNLEILSLRGRLLDLHGIARLLEQYEPGQFDLVILDAWYRGLPADVDENANGQITWLYNALDSLAAKLDVAWLNVHHATKGSQTGKAVTDVGAGAGSQSRAADAHIVLREHEEPDAAVMEAALRSFAPLEPLPLRWEFPLWRADSTLDPKALKGTKTRQEERQRDKDAEGFESITEALEAEPATVRELRRKTGMSRERVERLLDRMEADGEVIWSEVKVKGNTCRQYQLGAPQWDVGD